MDRILKERYKYMPPSRLADFSVGEAVSWGRAEVGIEADCRLYRNEPATAAEIEAWAGRMAEGILPAAGDPLLAANLAAPADRVQGVRIDIPDRFRAEGVLYLHFHYPAGEGGSNDSRYALRCTVRAGREAAVRIVVYHHPADGEERVIHALTCIEAGEGASVEMTEVTESRSVFLGSILSVLHRDARLDLATIDLDNAFLRRNQFVSLAEPGAECRLDGVYIADGVQQVDNYTRMHHAAARCTSGQLFKGVAADEARAAFTGHIHVAPRAQQTVALQENHNIVLSDGARVDTRPQLEIYADDVKCNHGATVGRLDPEAIYYMRQRGIGIEAAKRLQIEGFIHEIVDRNRSEDLSHLLREKITKRLQKV